MKEKSIKPKKQAVGVHRIQSVVRAVSILNLFSESNPRLSLGELAAGLHTGKPTAHRYAVSLVDAGMLAYDRATALYSISPGVLTMAAVALAGMSFISIAEEHMRHLLPALGETIVLAIWDDRVGGPIVARAVHGEKIGVRISIGYRLLKDSAHAKMFQALGRQRVNGKGPDLEPKEREEICRTGTAFKSPGDGYWAIAAPIFDCDALVATVAIVGLGDTVPESQRSHYCEQLKTTAANISQQISALHRINGNG